MRTLLAPLALAIALTAGATADSFDCPQDRVDATLETPAGTYYVVNDPCLPDHCLFSIWLYQETNGHPGLQRGDNLPCDCTDPPGCEPDTIIF